jgi:hypothetical protein
MPRSLLTRTAAVAAALTCGLAATAQACTHGQPPGGGSNAPAAQTSHHGFWGHHHCQHPGAGPTDPGTTTPPDDGTTTPPDTGGSS